MKHHHYKVDIRWSEEDEVYIARVPELDGVVTHGSTIIEAAKMADDAIKLHLVSLKKHTDIIPEPFALKDFSGKFPLRISAEAHMDLAIKARSMGLKLSEYLRRIIDEDLMETRASEHKQHSSLKKMAR